MHPEAAVTHHHFFAGIKQREAFLNRFNRIRQIGAGGFGFLIGNRQLGVGFIQQVQRPAQIAGAGANFVFQHHGALKLGIGHARRINILFHPPHQGGHDLQQFFVLPFQ